MSEPGEHKTVQTRILAYAQEIGWSFVPREEAEQRRGFDPLSPKGFGGTGREFVEHLRNRGKFFDHEENKLQNLFWVRLHELMTVEARAHELQVSA